MTDYLSDVDRHVGSKLLQAALFSGKTSNGVVRRPSQSERLKYLENGLSSNHQILHGIHADLAWSHPDMMTSTTPVGVYGSSRKPSKMSPPTALGRILVARHFAAQPVGGLFVELVSWLKKRFRRPTARPPARSSRIR